MMRWMAWIFLLIVVLFRNNPKQLIVEVDSRNLKLIKLTRKFATVYTVKKTVKVQFESTNIVLRVKKSFKLFRNLSGNALRNKKFSEILLLFIRSWSKIILYNRRINVKKIETFKSQSWRSMVICFLKKMNETFGPCPMSIFATWNQMKDNLD